jgi:hypothetical protein
MNAREQYLQKRVERLEALIAFLRADLDYTESAGAAFAFDLARHGDEEKAREMWDWWIDAMIRVWDAAVKEALREASWTKGSIP